MKTLDANIVANTDLVSSSSKLFVRECTGNDYTAFGVEEVIFSAQTQFQYAQFVKTHSYGLALYLDGAIQSAEFDEYIYHEALIHPALANLPQAREVLILGGGEGASAREALKYSTIERVDMVDIDGELVTLCQRLLPGWSDGAFDDPRLHLYIENALEFVKNTPRKYDLIIIDLIDEFAETQKNELVTLLYSYEFFNNVKNILAPGGAVVIQGSEFNAGEFASFAEIYRKISSVFHFAEPYSAYVPSFTSDWGFILCQDERSFAHLSAIEIDNRLANTMKPNNELSFYDGLTHQRLFSLSKDLRTLIAQNFEETLVDVLAV